MDQTPLVIAGPLFLGIKMEAFKARGWMGLKASDDLEIQELSAVFR